MASASVAGMGAASPAGRTAPAGQAGGQRRAVGAVRHHESAAEPGLRSSREGTAGVGEPGGGDFGLDDRFLAGQHRVGRVGPNSLRENRR
jgi:hypothetical protein